MTESPTVRVLMLLNSLAPGGTEQSSVLLAPALRDFDIDVSILTLRSAAHELNEVAASHGVEVVQLAQNGWISHVRQVRALIRTREPHIVHTALFDADLVGRLAAARTGVPVVSSLVSTPYDSARLADPNVRTWKLRSVQVIDAVTGRLLVDRFHSVSEGVKAANGRSLRLPANRIIVAERGRDESVLGLRTPERRSAIRLALGLGEKTPMVLNLGRLEHQKGQVDLIRAMSCVSKRHPSVELLIAGKDGSATSRVRDALRDDPSTAKRIRLLGHRTDVGDLLVAADALVISSLFEGTAGVALEAMALGTPIVSTDLDGLRGILRPGETALLVPRADPSALAAAINRVLADHRLAAGLTQRARSEFDDRFTLRAAASRLADLYHDVAHRAGGLPTQAPSPRS